MVGDDILNIDVYRSRSSREEANPFLAVRAANALDLQFRFLDAETLLPDRLGDVITAMAVVLVDDALLQDTDLQQALEQRIEQYSLMLILNYLGDEKASQNIKFDFYGKWVELTELSGVSSLPDLVRETVNLPLRKLLQERSLLNTLKPALVVSRELIQKEMNSRLLASELRKILPGGPNREAILSNYQLLKAKLSSEGDASEIAAKIIVSTTQSGNN
jgi:hypothetical protein